MTTTVNETFTKLNTTYLELGGSCGNPIHVSKFVMAKIPPNHKSSSLPPCSPIMLNKLYSFVYSLKKTIQKNNFIIDLEEIFVPDMETSLGKLSPAWWRIYKMGWLANQFTINNGDGFSANFVSALFSDKNDFRISDAAIFFDQVFLFAVQDNRNSILILWDKIKANFTSLEILLIQQYLIGFSHSENVSKTFFWLLERDFEELKNKIEVLKDYKHWLKQHLPNKDLQNDWADGFPKKEEKKNNDLFAGLVNLIDFGQIYSVETLVKMALYQSDKNNRSKSLYALISHADNGFVPGEEVDESILLLLLSPYGTGFIRRTHSTSNLFKRMRNRLSYQNIAYDLNFAMVCDIIVNSSTTPLLPGVWGDHTPPLSLDSKWVEPKLITQDFIYEKT